MSEPASVVKAAFDKAMTMDSNPLKVLEATNWITWYEDFKNQAGRYGYAGEEVLNKKLFDFTPEIRCDSWSYQVRNSSTGVVENRTVPWDDRADKELQARNLMLEKKAELCVAQRGRLWAHAFSKISADVKSRLKVSYGKIFPKVQATKNCVALFQMFMIVCNGLSKDRLLDLMVKLQNIHHKHGGEDFDTFIVRFESLLKQVKAAGQKINEREKMQYLCRAVDTDFWKSELSKCHALDVTDPGYPRYKDMLPQMSKYYRSLMHNHKKRKREEGEDNGRDDLGNPITAKTLKKHLSAQKAELMAMFAKAVDKKPGVDDAAKGDGAKVEIKTTCFRCGLKGHRSRECKAREVKCTTCGSDRHCTKMHKQAEAFKEKMAKGKATVAEHKMMEAIEVTADGDPIIGTRYGHGVIEVGALLAEQYMIEVNELHGMPNNNTEEAKAAIAQSAQGEGESEAASGAAEEEHVAQAEDEADEAESDSNADQSAVGKAGKRQGATKKELELPVAERSASGSGKRGHSAADSSADNTKKRRVVQGGAAAPVPKVPTTSRFSAPDFVMPGTSRDPPDNDPYLAIFGADSESEPDESEWDNFCSEFDGTAEEKAELNRLVEKWSDMSEPMVKILYGLRHRELELRRAFLRDLEGLFDGNMHRISRNVDKPFRTGCAAHAGNPAQVRRLAVQAQYTDQVSLRRHMADLLKDRPEVPLEDPDIRAALRWMEQPLLGLPALCNANIAIPSVRAVAAARRKAESEAKEVASRNTTTSSAGGARETKSSAVGTVKSPAKVESKPEEKKSPVAGTIRKKFVIQDDDDDEDEPPKTVTVAKKPDAKEKSKAGPSSAAKGATERGRSAPVSGVKASKETTPRAAPTPNVVKLAGRSIMERDGGALHTQRLTEKRTTEGESRKSDVGVRASSEGVASAAAKGVNVDRVAQAADSNAMSAKAAAASSAANVVVAQPNEIVPEPAKATTPVIPVFRETSGEELEEVDYSSDSPNEGPTVKEPDATAPKPYAPTDMVEEIPVEVESEPYAPTGMVEETPAETETTPYAPTEVVVEIPAESHVVKDSHNGTKVEPMELEEGEVFDADLSAESALPLSVETPDVPESKMEVDSAVHTASDAAKGDKGVSSPLAAQADSTASAPTGAPTPAAIKPPAAAQKKVQTVSTAMIDPYALPAGHKLVKVQLNGGGSVQSLERMDGAPISYEEMQDLIQAAQDDPAADVSVSVMPACLLKARMTRGVVYAAPTTAHCLTVRVELVDGERVFIVDSGASTAVFRSWDEFGDFEPLNAYYEMRAANGAKMNVDKVGTTKGLGRVIVSRDARCDVLSVSQIIDANPGCEVTFKGRGVLINHPRLSAGIWGNRTATGLYSINLAAVQKLIRSASEQVEVYPIIANTVSQSAAMGDTAVAATADGAVSAQAVGVPSASAVARSVSAEATQYKRVLTPKEGRN